MIHPRRSVLFMPGSNQRAMEKARSLAADGIILDLEDAVAPEAKPLARQQIATAITAGGFGKRERIIRTNDIHSPFWADDSAMAAKAQPDAILVPKVSGPEDIAVIARRLDELGAAPAIRIWAMIETPLALLQIGQIAACAQDEASRLAVFVLGPNDLSLQTRIRMTPGRAEMTPLFLGCVIAARSYGVEVLDGPYNNFSDANGFARECEQARDLGFDGKTLIHPSQIDAANAVFTPARAELAWSRKVIAAFDLPENINRGAINLEGQMVERMHAKIAQRTLAMADAIAALQES